MYYKTRDAQKVAGWVRLSQVTRVEPMEPDFVAPGALLPRNHVFRVVIVQRTLYFCGESAADVSQGEQPGEGAAVDARTTAPACDPARPRE